MHRRLRIRFGPFALVVLLALLGCARGKCVRIVGSDGKPRATVAVEVANTGPQRELGLMYRKHLDENAGMIFVFKDAARQNFWMHNTPISLDIIFADAAGLVMGIVANAELSARKTESRLATLRVFTPRVRIIGRFARRPARYRRRGMPDTRIFSPPEMHQ